MLGLGPGAARCGAGAGIRTPAGRRPEAPPPEAPPPEPAPEPSEDEPPVPDAPGLSLEELGERLQQTRAIGVFTKLALRNDVDDLIDALAAHHESGKGELGGLEVRFEALVLKLLALLEEKEPDLARSLARSRREIWSRLADPVRFAELTS